MSDKRELNISKGFNFRDIGGYKNELGEQIKWHKIVRAAYLSDLDLHDQQLLFDYGIRTIIDLRSDAETKKYPDRYISSIHYVHIPILNEDLTNSTTRVDGITGNISDKNGLKHMLKVYRLLVTNKPAQQAYQKIFNLLAELNKGVLIHCATGKDRTGIVIMLLLKLLGIPNQVILADYLMTNKCSSLHINKRLIDAKINGADTQLLKTIFNLSTVNLQYYNEVIATVKNHYGDFSNYFSNYLNVNDALIKCLRLKYLN